MRETENPITTFVTLSKPGVPTSKQLNNPQLRKVLGQIMLSSGDSREAMALVASRLGLAPNSTYPEALEAFEINAYED